MMKEAAKTTNSWLRLLGGAILLLMLLAGAGYFLLDPSRFQPLVEAELGRSLARKVSLGKMSVSLVPPSFEASSLAVGDDLAFSTKPFLVSQGVRIKPSWLALLRGKVEIDSLEINGPAIELIANGAGVWNYESLGGPKKTDGGPPAFQISRLLVTDATLGVTPAGARRDLYRHIALEVKDYAGEGKPFFVRVGATLVNTLAEETRISAEGNVEQAGKNTKFNKGSFSLAGLTGKVDGSIEGEELNLRVEVPKSPLAQLAPLFLPKGMKADGDIAGTVEAKGTLKAPELRGQVEVTSFAVSGGEIKQPVRTAKLLLRLDPERITLEPAQVLSGSTQLQVLGVVSQYRKTPIVEATLVTQQAKLAELLGIARAYGISAVEGIRASSGEARLQVRAHGPLQALKMTGSGALSGATLELPTLTKAVEVANVEFRFEEDSVALSKLDARLGGSHPTGELRVSNFRAPKVSFNLAVDRVDTKELQALLKPAPESKDGAKEGAREGAEPPRLSASGALSIGTLQLEKLTLTQVRGQAEFAGQQLQLEPLTANIYGGVHSGRLTADFRPKLPVYTLDSKLERIESSLLLAATTALKGAVSGPLSGQVRLRMSPGEPEAMARSLNGQLSFKIDRGRLASFNLTNELAGVAKFMGFSPSGENFTQFQTLGGDLKLENGVASTDNFRLDLSNISATMNGSMNFADQTLSLKVLSVLSRGFTERVGGNRVGGFMSAALSNNKGEMLIPVVVTGSFLQPRISPDTGEMARLKLQQFNPKDPAQAIDSVNSVLKLFRKKKPEEVKPPEPKP